jgi:uncharacterized protein YggE
MLFFSSNALAASMEASAPIPSISSSGEATVYVTPDEAVISLGVEILHKDLDQAVAQNDEASNRLMKAIKQFGVESRDIQTDHVNVSIRYDSNQHLTVEGYVARRSYSVTLKEIGKLEGLVQTALKSGANTLTGVEFRTTKLRKYRDQARSLAIKAAKEKAVALATDLECRVLAPRTIQEAGGSWAYCGGPNWRGNIVSQNAVQFAPEGGGADGDTMPLGQIAVYASISVTFDLDPHAAKDAAQQ